MMKKCMLFMVLGLAACHPVVTEPSKPLAAAAKNKAQLILYRPSSFLLLARTPEVRVENKECSLGQDDYAVAEVPPGLTTITSNPWDGEEALLSLELDAGMRYYIRVSPKHAPVAVAGDLKKRIKQSTATDGDWFVMDLVPNSYGEQEMAGFTKIACEPSP